MLWQTEHIRHALPRIPARCPTEPFLLRFNLFLARHRTFTEAAFTTRRHTCRHVVIAHQSRG